MDVLRLLGARWFVLRLLGGIGVMRKKLLVICGLFALVGTIAVAAVLGIAGTGKAASTNTCALVGGAPNCLTVGVFPGQLSPTGKGLIVAKFVNQGSATATHAAIKLTLPSNVIAVSVSPSALCTAPGSTITCSFGNIPGFGTAKVSVAFTTTAVRRLNSAGDQCDGHVCRGQRQQRQRQLYRLGKRDLDRGRNVAGR